MTEFQAPTERTSQTAKESEPITAMRPRLPQEKLLSERTWAELFPVPEHPRSNASIDIDAQQCAKENPIFGAFGRHFSELDSDRNGFLDSTEIKQSVEWFKNFDNDPLLSIDSRRALVGLAEKLSKDTDAQMQLRGVKDDLVKEKTPPEKRGISLEDLKEHNRTAYLQDGFEGLRNHLNQIDGTEVPPNLQKILSTAEIQTLAEASQDPYVRTAIYKVLNYMKEHNFYSLSEDELKSGQYTKDLPSDKDSIRLIEFGTVSALYRY